MSGDTELLVVLARAHVNPSRVGHLWCIALWNCQSACTGLARSPVGGAPQGWQDSNLRHAVLEAAVLAAELHPYETENRPPGVSLRAAPGPGLLIVAVTQLPPLGWAAHYYPGQH